MTANHAHTPSTEHVRLAATSPNENFSLKGTDFDRWLAARDARIRAAAEQRGKEQGWDEAMTKQIQRLISGDPDVERFQMPANPYRADRIANKEGGDETH